MILFSKIRRMYFLDKSSINEIAKRASLARNTVKACLERNPALTKNEKSPGSAGETAKV